MSHDKLTTPTDEQLPTLKVKTYASEIIRWATRNSGSILSALALATSTSFLIWYIHSSDYVHRVAANDVSNTIESYQETGEYLDQVESIPQSIRKASVAFRFFDIEDYKHGTCTGTILEKIGDFYIMKSEIHCFEDEEGNPYAQNGSKVWLGSSPDGTVSETPNSEYETEAYYPVPGTNIGFMIFEDHHDQIPSFIPLGPNKLSVFDSTGSISLSGLGYPKVTEGLPFPINIKLGPDPTSGDFGTISVPVESFPFSIVASGTGLVNEQGNLVALANGISIDRGTRPPMKKILISPVTQQVVRFYEMLVEKYSGKG